MAISIKERAAIIRKIEASVRDKFYDPSFDEIAWHSIVERHRPEILDADGTDGFERAVSRLLAAFSPGTSLGLLSARTAITPRNAINASFATIRIDGEPRWVFQDVLPTGLADKAGACPGDVVLEVDGAPVSPPESGKGGPTFAMGRGFAITVQRGAVQTKRTLSFITPLPKYKDNPYAGLTSISYKKLGEGIDHLRIGIFQGQVGIDFANDLDQLFTRRIGESKGLIIDLRGNPGGGIGGLALMSYLTPDRLPVGYSQNRKMAVENRAPDSLPIFDKVPRSRLAIPGLALKFMGKTSVFLFTEGLGKAAYKRPVVLLVNEHTTGAGEMVAQFAQENGFATLVGTRTPGRLVSRSATKLGSGYRLIVPVAAYVSAKGRRIEGNGIIPDVPVPWVWEDARAGKDNQLEAALEVFRRRP